MKKRNIALSPFIGETESSLPYPVFYDPHYALLNNGSPVTLVTGSSGSGKTFFGLLLGAQSSILGKVNFVIDPKGDFIALKMMERLNIVNKVQIWSILGEDNKISEDNIGMLDPTCFFDNPTENANMTLDVIKTLVGKLSEKQENKINAIARDVCNEKDCSLSMVSREIMRIDDEEVRNVGIKLDTVLNSPIAQILTRPRKYKNSYGHKTSKNSFDVITDGTVVVNLMGLQFPKENKDSGELKSTEKLSVCIMYLITTLVLRIMENIGKQTFKTLFVDEAWVTMSTEYGRKMLASLSRLGRSLNMASVLMTQSPSHLNHAELNDLNTNISTRFAFKNTNEKDNIMTCRDMNLPEGEGWENLLPQLSPGICLMQDSDRNKGLVSIQAIEGWHEIFETNPLSALKGKS